MLCFHITQMLRNIVQHPIRIYKCRETAKTEVLKVKEEKMFCKS